MRQVIKHRDLRLLNMIRRTDPVILSRFFSRTPRNVTKPLNICSDFHLDRHFFGLVGGFFVGLFVTLWLEMALGGGYSMKMNAPNGIFPRKIRIYNKNNWYLC